jgi:hypothetical protein
MCCAVLWARHVTVLIAACGNLRPKTSQSALGVGDALRVSWCGISNSIIDWSLRVRLAPSIFPKREKAPRLRERLSWGRDLGAGCDKNFL